MIEVMYEVRGSGSFFIASEEAEPAGGWDYTDILSAFIETGMTPARMAETVVSAYSRIYENDPGMTLSAIDLSKIDDLYAAMNTLSQTLSNACKTTPEAKEEIRGLLLNSIEDFYGDSYPTDLNVDIADLARKVSSETEYADAEADALGAAVASAVVAEWHHPDRGAAGNPEAGGIAIHLVMLETPQEPAGHDDAYFREFGSTEGSQDEHPLSFTSDSLWVPSRDQKNGLLYHLFHDEQQ